MSIDVLQAITHRRKYPQLGKIIEPEKALEARKILQNAGMKIPRNEIAYEATNNNEDKFQQIIREILIEQLGIKKLIHEGTQSKLETNVS